MAKDNDIELEYPFPPEIIPTEGHEIPHFSTQISEKIKTAREAITTKKLCPLSKKVVYT